MKTKVLINFAIAITVIIAFVTGMLSKWWW